MLQDVYMSRFDGLSGLAVAAYIACVVSAIFTALDLAQPVVSLSPLRPQLLLQKAIQNDSERSAPKPCKKGGDSGKKYGQGGVVQGISWQLGTGHPRLDPCRIARRYGWRLLMLCAGATRFPVIGLGSGASRATSLCSLMLLGCSSGGVVLAGDDIRSSATLSMRPHPGYCCDSFEYLYWQTSQVALDAMEQRLGRL